MKILKRGFLMAVCGLLINFNITAKTTKAVELESIAKGEKFSIIADKSVLKVFSNEENIYLLFKLNDKEDDEDEMTLVDKKDRSYVSVKKRDIKSVLALKNMFVSQNQNTEKKVNAKQLINTKKNINIASFLADIYRGPFVETDLITAVSKSFTKFLQQNCSYNRFVKFVEEIKLDELGIIDHKFLVVLELFERTKEIGTVMKIELYDVDEDVTENIFEIKKVTIKNIDASVFDIPKGYVRKGIEQLVKNIK